jgi:hypothetical protein
VFLLLIPVHVFLIAGILTLITRDEAHWLFQVGFLGTVIMLFLALVYAFIIVILIWRRTGLIWYLFDSDQRGLQAILTTVYVLVVLVVMWLVVRKFEVDKVALFLLIVYGASLLLLFLSKKLWGRAVIQRVMKERDKNDSLWQALKQVSVRGILLMRIPRAYELQFQDLDIQGRG